MTPSISTRSIAPWSCCKRPKRLSGPPTKGASAESLPYEDDAFDLVTSNGALNLVPDKDALFGELQRVLRPGGVLAVADLVVTDEVPLQTLASLDAWST